MLDFSRTGGSTLSGSQEAKDSAELRLILANPRGFCAGVKRAIDAVRDALATHGPPVYVRRAIVHNVAVVEALESEGAVFVEELDQVPAGAVVLFSAHGVSPSVAADARARGLRFYDAVCPLVLKVHREVEQHDRNGRALILVGHVGHPEIEGTLGFARSSPAFVVSNRQEVDALPLDDATPSAFAIQTTYSVDDAASIVEALRNRFSDLVGPSSSDICYATTNRQAAVHRLAPLSDCVIVVGEAFSSNACRLAETARLYCPQVQLVPEPYAIEWTKVPVRGTVGITAAASTPEASVQAVVAAFGERFSIEVEELEFLRERAVFKPLAIS